MSLKQEAAIQELVESRGRNVGKAMIKAGYSKASAKNPKNLTESKAFKNYYEQTKLLALKKHNITWDRILKPISDALEATTSIRDKDGVEITEVADLNTRLRASKQAAEMLKVKDEIDPNETIPESLPKGMDLVEAQRLLFRKRT